MASGEQSTPDAHAVEAMEHNRRRGETEDEAFLRTLVDLTWGEAFEDRSVPSSAIQARLIARARAAREACRGR